MSNLKGLAALAILLATPERVDAQPFFLHFDSNCTEAEVFADAVIAQVGTSPFSRSATEAMTVWVRREGEVVRGRVVRGPSSREAEGADCAEVVEALATIVAVSLDAGPVQQAAATPQDESAEPTRRGWAAMARYVDRPMTLPEGVFRTSLRGVFSDLARFGSDEVGGVDREVGTAAAGGSLNARYGLTADLELGLDGTRVGHAPSSGFGMTANTDQIVVQPTLFARLRYLGWDNLELGTELTLEIPTGDGLVASMSVLQMRVREDIVRFGLRADAAIAHNDEGQGWDGIAQGNLNFAINLGDHAFIGADVHGRVIGWRLETHSVRVGVGLTVGATIDLDDVILDMAARGHLPAMITTDERGQDAWLFDLGVTLYLPVNAATSSG